MQATRDNLEALLGATERLLNAREVQMLTTEVWELDQVGNWLHDG
jgi:hypothetical protein